MANARKMAGCGLVEAREKTSAVRTRAALLTFVGSSNTLAPRYCRSCRQSFLFGPPDALPNAPSRYTATPLSSLGGSFDGPESSMLAAALRTAPDATPPPRPSDLVGTVSTTWTSPSSLPTLGGIILPALTHAST